MVKEKVHALKEHIKDHKEAYITGAICLVSGLAIGVLVSDSKPAVSIKSWRFWSPGDNISQVILLPALGDPGNVIQRLDTMEFYASQGQCARALGVDPWVVSNYLKGLLPDVKGVQLKIVGKAGHPLAV